MTQLSKSFVEEIVREAILRCMPVAHPASPDSVAEDFYHSLAANRIKDEIVRTGRKLWERQYVDGNGGNVSCRVAEDYVLCTPTMCSKGDLTPQDISLVNLNNERVCGDRPHTSEVLFHLEIYKAVPEARAVIHCHPPHATAYAITGLVPPGGCYPRTGSVHRPGSGYALLYSGVEGSCRKRTALRSKAQLYPSRKSRHCLLGRRYCRRTGQTLPESDAAMARCCLDVAAPPPSSCRSRRQTGAGTRQPRSGPSCTQCCMESAATSSWRGITNHVNIAYAPSDEEADKALQAKAAMMSELGIKVHLCGS